MPRLAANLTLLFNDVGFLDRFGRAAAAGFRAVECQLPYAHEAGEIAAQLREHELTLVLHNMPAGDWDSGERGIACLPDRVAEFEAGVDEAIEYARRTGCSRVNCLAGIRPPDVDVRVAQDTFVRNLQFAAPRFLAAGIALLVEPINTHDVPGFFLSGTAQALEIIEAVSHDGVWLQFDAYHMHRMGEDIVQMVEQHLDRIGHVQIADVPGRHEPGTGTIAYPPFLARLDRLAYAGWVGCEYVPTTSTEAGLGWAEPYL